MALSGIAGRPARQRGAGFGPLQLLGRVSETRWWAYLLLLPSLILILAIIFYPVAEGFILSFREMKLNRPALGTGFVGFRHYVDLWHDEVFWIAVRNTVVYVGVSVVLELALGLIVALALVRGLPGSGLMGVLILVPWFLPNVVAGNIWALMLDPRLGVINDILVKVGILGSYKAWFADPLTALPAAIAVEVWHGFPFFALLLIAALKGIPKELLEAAGIDGASRPRTFWSVTLPLLRPIIVATVLLRVISLFNSPDLLLILTGGGPGYATRVLSLHAFETAYRAFDFGYAAAISVVMFLALAVLYYTCLGASQGMRRVD